MNLPLIPFHSIAVSIPFQWWFHLTKHSLMASLWYTREKCRRRMPWDVAVNVTKGCPVRRVSITRELVVTLQNSTKVLNHCGLSLWMLGDKVAFNLGRSFKGKVSYILCHEPVSFPHNQNYLMKLCGCLPVIKCFRLSLLGKLEELPRWFSLGMFRCCSVGMSQGGVLLQLYMGHVQYQGRIG